MSGERVGRCVGWQVADDQPRRGLLPVIQSQRYGQRQWESVTYMAIDSTVGEKAADESSSLEIGKKSVVVAPNGQSAIAFLITCKQCIGRGRVSAEQRGSTWHPAAVWFDGRSLLIIVTASCLLQSSAAPQPTSHLHRVVIDRKEITSPLSTAVAPPARFAMVVLAASVCTRGGKPIISRQFRDMSRSRVEVLLSSFPKLISSNSQHTSIETDSVRYVYQPLEDLYMILITNKNSNILQDIDTLHLFGRLVTDLCSSGGQGAAGANAAMIGGVVPGVYRSGTGKVDERQVLRISFELLGAFDEIIAMGYRENVNLMQIKSTLEMESHEEKIQEIIERVSFWSPSFASFFSSRLFTNDRSAYATEQNKEQEAKEELKRRAKQLEMQRREATRRGVPASNFGASGGSGGFGTIPQSTTTAAVHRENLGADRSNGGSTANSGGGGKPFKGKGMQLGKKVKTTNMYGTGEAQPLIDPVVSSMATTAPTPATAAASSAALASSRTPASAVAASDPHSILPPIAKESVHILVRERVTLQADRDGGVQSMEIKGDLEVRISDASVSKLRLTLDAESSGLTGQADTAMGWKTHPHVDKAKWTSEKTIALKDAARSFPLNQTLGVLRWRNTSVGKDETLVPISITAWPSPNAQGGAEVTIEFNTDALEARGVKLPLRDVSLVVPLPKTLDEPTAQVIIGDVSHGSAEVVTGEEDGQDPAVIWQLGEEVNAGESGSLEFTVATGLGDGSDLSAFFPVQVDFWSEGTIGNVTVSSHSWFASASQRADSVQIFTGRQSHFDRNTGRGPLFAAEHLQPRDVSHRMKCLVEQTSFSCLCPDQNPGYLSIFSRDVATLCRTRSLWFASCTPLVSRFSSDSKFLFGNALLCVLRARGSPRPSSH